MERGQRISGLRARVIEASLVMPILLAACGDNTPATQKPINTHNETPAPTILVTPDVTTKPIITPTPTPEITPVPTPEATPVPIADLINQVVADAKQNGWPSVSKQDVKNSIDLAYENDPEAASIINTNENILERDMVNKLWDKCSSSQNQDDIKAVCATLSNHLYWKGFRVDENAIWVPSFPEIRKSPFSDIIYYTHSVLKNPDDFNGFVYRISQSISPF